MNNLFGSGALIDLIIAITIAEGLFLAGYHRLTGKGVGPREFGANLLSGLLLMVAVRNVVGGTWWGWTALCLGVSGVVHATDIWRRWQR